MSCCKIGEVWYQAYQDEEKEKYNYAYFCQHYQSVIRIVNELGTKLNIADVKSIDTTASFSNSERENEVFSAYPKNTHDTLRHRLIPK